MIDCLGVRRNKIHLRTIGNQGTLVSGRTKLAG